MIHPQAFVDDEVHIGQGTDVWMGTHIRERAYIGMSCVIGEQVYIDHGVVVGNLCKIQNGAKLYHPAALEDGVFIGPGACVINDKYPRAMRSDGTMIHADGWTPRGSRIKRGASIATGAIIMPGVTVGEWALVGAGSVVTRDVAPHMMVHGSPATTQCYVCFCGKPMGHESTPCPACGYRKG